MSPSRRRTVTGAAAAVLLAMGLGYAFWPQPVPVDLAVVAPGELVVTVDEEGETRVKDVYVVSAPVHGRVLRIESEVGDEVVAGETVVATIDETAPTFLNVRSRRQAEAEVKAAEAALALAEAEVGRARAELDFALNDLDRARRLASRETISERAVDVAELEVRTRQAALATTEAQLRVRHSEVETARAALIEPQVMEFADHSGRCCLRLVAPVSGRVLRVPDESERVVTAGTPLLEVGDPQRLEIVVDLLSQDAVKVERGADVMIEDWGGGDMLHGQVRRVEPYGYTKVSALGIEEQRVNVIVDFTDPETAKRLLGHGYRVATRIVIWRGEDVLKLPLAALFRTGDAWTVFAHQDGRAELRQVTLGRQNDLTAEVLAGVARGEEVVLHPSDRLHDGVGIVVRATASLH